MIQRSFEIALKKGELGEKIIQEHLESKGWIVYFPFTKDKPHYFDILATKNKERVIAVDVKTKARLNKYNAQGIDVRHYKEYMNFIQKTKIPFYLIFVNDKDGNVHVAELSKLSKGFNPRPDIIAWNLDEMKLLFNIGDELIKQLSYYDQRSYEYKPE